MDSAELENVLVWKTSVTNELPRITSEHQGSISRCLHILNTTKSIINDAVVMTSLGATIRVLEVMSYEANNDFKK